MHTNMQFDKGKKPTGYTITHLVKGGSLLPSLSKETIVYLSIDSSVHETYISSFTIVPKHIYCRIIIS